MLRFLILALLALPAYAQTYKWVDAKGVVNYSNTPPPGGAEKAVTVPDRISNYTPDPALNQAVAVDRRLAAMDAEWLQRQWLMAMQQPAPAPATDYRMSSYYPAVVVVSAHRPHFLRHTFFSQPAFSPRPMHAQPRPVRPARLNF